MSFENWKARLAGSKDVKTFLQAQPEDEGYYRKPITEPVLGPNGKTNGQKRIIDFVPCAYFIADGKLCGVIGAGNDLRDMTDNEVGDEGLWSWVCRYPISYETYVDVAEDGKPWPDFTNGKWTPITLEGALKRSLAADAKPVATDNAPTEPEAPKVKTAADYKKEIETMIANTPVKVLTSNEEAATVLGDKNALADIRLKADKDGRAIYEPLYREYQAVQKSWAPMVKLADDHEKRLNNSILVWREKERRRLADEQAAAARAIQEEEERNARAADRAIARGEEPPPPEITEIVVPTAVLPKLVPTVGTRTVREELKTFVTITDAAKVANHFIGSPELLAVLQSLAERAIKLGQEVPGTTTRKGLV